MQEESGSKREPHAEDVHLDSAGGAVLPLEVHQLVVRLEDGHEALPGGEVATRRWRTVMMMDTVNQNIHAWLGDEATHLLSGLTILLVWLKVIFPALNSTRA